MERWLYYLLLPTLTFFLLYCSREGIQFASGPRTDRVPVENPIVDVPVIPPLVVLPSVNPPPVIPPPPKPRQIVSEKFFVNAPGAQQKAVVDIILLTDLSSSMGDELRKVEKNIAMFLSQFVAQQATLDFQLILMGGENDNSISYPNTILADPRVELLNTNKDHPLLKNGIGSNNALGVAWDFLSGVFPQKQLKLRPGAVKELVFITDDNAGTGDSRGITADTFVQNLSGHPEIGKVKVNGFVGLSTSVDNDDCGISSVGEGYIQLAKLYGGLIDDLCNQDWGKMLGSLAKAIIPQPLPINRNFDLMGMAKLGDILKVRVNGRELSNSEYSFDDASDTIRIGSSVALHDGEQIEVEYYK